MKPQADSANGTPPAPSPKPDGRGRRRDSVVRLLWIGVLLANLFVVGFVALVLDRSHAREVERATVTTENLSKVLEENLAGFIGKIDVTLLTLIDEFTRSAVYPPGTESFDAFLARRAAQLPETLGIRVLDTEGTVTHAAGDPRLRTEAPVTPAGLLPPHDDPAALAISGPIAGPAPGTWLITFSRRIDGADGRPAGAAQVVVAVERFIDMFSAINLGRHGNVGLWDKHRIVARYARDDARGGSVGVTTASAQLRALLDSGRSAAPYRAQSGVDGVTRAFFFRQVKQYPLYLVVGMADEDYLANWRTEAAGMAGLAILFAVATLLACWLIEREWRRREDDQAALLRHREEHAASLERAREEAETAHRRSELVLSSAGEGICGIDTEGKVVFVNPAARRMLGWDENEGIGFDLHMLTHHHHPDGTEYSRCDCPVFATLADGKWRQVKDDVYWRRDGSSFPVEFTAAAIVEDGRIIGAVNVFRDITERKALEERVGRMALHDALTGLPNRFFLDAALRRTTAIATRRDEAVCILYVDLDGFKQVNDSHGHAAGDGLLREVAARLRACVRAEDVLARLGGDEFIVVSLAPRDTAKARSMALAERIIASVAQPVALDAGTARVGASVGIAIFPDCGDSIDACLREADAAMYRAKAAGKGRAALAGSGIERPPPARRDGGAPDELEPMS